MSFRWKTSGRGEVTLDAIRAFVDEVTKDLDPNSRYITELRAVIDASQSVEDYLSRLEDPERVEVFQKDGAQASHGERGRSWVDEETWTAMDPFERTLSNLLSGETRMMWAGEGAANYAELGAVLASLDAPRRALSVPCSTGKEPYSIAIAALAAGVGDLSVIGVDRQADYVQRAASGILVPHWRDLELEGVDRYLLQDGGRLQVSDELRALCSFEQGDVLTGELPPGPFGLVSCRNLLGYFRGASLELAWRNVSSRVAPGGYLLLDYFVSGSEEMRRVQELLRAEGWTRRSPETDYYQRT